MADRLAVAVEEAGAVELVADVLDEDQLGVEAGLRGGLGHVGDGVGVLDDQLAVSGVVQRREVQAGALVEAPALEAEVAPLLDELLVQAVELVGVGPLRLDEPLPLGRGRLDERGRGVGVELGGFTAPAPS